MKDKRNPAYRSDMGVTLTEMMVVIGLLAIIAGFAYPSIMNWLPNYRLKAAARDMVSNMQKTRLNAVKENRSWAIVFDVTGNRYFICSGPGGDDTWSTIGDNTIVENISLNTYKSGISYGHGNATTNATQSGGAFPDDNVSFSNNVAVFSSRGFSSGSGYCYLSNNKGIAYAIGAQTSGVISLKKWYGPTAKWE